MHKIFFFGYPGDMGGANTEAWHTIKLWRQHDIEVIMIPTWGSDLRWMAKLNEIGCKTISIKRDELLSNNLVKVPDLPGSITVGMCNNEYIGIYDKLNEMKCKSIWINCMTFMFDSEKKAFAGSGAPGAMIYQSEFQRSQIEPELLSITDYNIDNGYTIHGAFDINEFLYKPRQHEDGEPFYFGKIARPDLDKWSSNLWEIYRSVQYQNKRAIVMGTNEKTLEKLGKPPVWIDALAPMAATAQQFYGSLHCLLTVNGGARENWPRVGLEAMSSGVPIVTENKWGWSEMIEHGTTGFLANNDCELAHYAAMLAYDENLRIDIAGRARKKVKDELANPNVIWSQWEQVFNKLNG